MASQNKIIEMIGAIKTIYSYYAKDTDVALLVKTWGTLLKDYEDKLVEAAFYKCLQRCKMPPTPADVIEEIAEIGRASGESDEELWSLFCRELRNVSDQMYYFQFTYVDESGTSQGQRARKKVDDIWDGLPEKIKRYCGSKGEMMRMARESNVNEEFLSWEKQRFMKNMPIMQKRQEYSSFLLEGGNKFLLNEKGN